MSPTLHQSTADMLTTEEVKAASYQKLKHIQPVLLRYSYNPDARRFPLPGIQESVAWNRSLDQQLFHFSHGMVTIQT